MAVFTSFLFFLILWGICSFFTYSYAEKHLYTIKPEYHPYMSLSKTIIWNLHERENFVLAICTYLFLTLPGLFILVFALPIFAFITN